MLINENELERRTSAECVRYNKQSSIQKLYFINQNIDFVRSKQTNIYLLFAVLIVPVSSFETWNNYLYLLKIHIITIELLTEDCINSV